jgi:hypothetical protein
MHSVIVVEPFGSRKLEARSTSAREAISYGVEGKLFAEYGID